MRKPGHVPSRGAGGLVQLVQLGRKNQWRPGDPGAGSHAWQGAILEGENELLGTQCTAPQCPGMA